MRRLSLNKKERLKSRKTISTLFAQGKVSFFYPLRIVWLPTIPLYKGKGGSPKNNTAPTPPPAQTAFSVSSRRFPKAADRNRIKRQMREAFRLNKISLYQSLQHNNQHIAVMFIYIAPKPLEFAPINAAVQNTIRYLCQIIETKPE